MGNGFFEMVARGANETLTEERKRQKRNRKENKKNNKPLFVPSNTVPNKWVQYACRSDIVELWYFPEVELEGAVVGGFNIVIDIATAVAYHLGCNLILELARYTDDSNFTFISQPFYCMNDRYEMVVRIKNRLPEMTFRKCVFVERKQK